LRSHGGRVSEGFGRRYWEIDGRENKPERNHEAGNKKKSYAVWSSRQRGVFLAAERALG